nr:hypothetical protein [Tanacetum cinerariifolium]
MSTLIFAKTHNLIAYLAKPTKSEGFEQIIDFLNGSSVSYALTASLTIRTSCIKQFWTTAKVKTINDEVRIQALIDEKRVNIKESSIHHTLKLNDAEGTSCLANVEIFDGLAKMGYEKLSEKLTFYKAFFLPQWNTMASSIICLATNLKFNFSRFVQLLIDNQLGDMSHHKDIYDNPSLTKKVFTNMKRVGTGFSELIPTKPSTSKPYKKHKPKKQQPQAPKVPSPEPSPKHRLPLPSNDPLPSEVVTTAGATTTAKATKVSVLRRRKGVVIQDHEETTSIVVVHSEVESKDKGKVRVPSGYLVVIQDHEETTSIVVVHSEVESKDKGKGILIKELKSLKGYVQIEQDEAFTRQLEVELNANINWNAVIKQVKRIERLNDAMIKYQALKKKPLTKAQARKNMIIYLKNMVGGGLLGIMNFNILLLLFIFSAAAWNYCLLHEPFINSNVRPAHSSRVRVSTLSRFNTNTEKSKGVSISSLNDSRESLFQAKVLIK